MKSPFFHLIIWLSICVASIAGYWFWYTTVANESVAVASLQNQIDTRTQTSIRIAAARSALAEIAGDESIVQGYFVPQAGIVPFIDDLQARAAAQKAVMQILSVSTGSTAKQSNLAFLLTISVDGTFDAVMRTIGAVEYAPYDLSISKLSVGETGKNVWHADLDLTVGSVATNQATSTPTMPLTASSSNSNL